MKRASVVVLLGVASAALAAPKKSGFERAMRLAGMALAHGLSSIEHEDNLYSGVLIPIVLSENAAGKRISHRFMKDEHDLAPGVRMGLEHLEKNPEGMKRAVLVFDGIMAPGKRRDALIAIAVEYGPPRRAMEIAVPFQPRWGPRPPRVGKPRFELSKDVDEDADVLSKALSGGVNELKEAAALWARYYDDRI